MAKNKRSGYAGLVVLMAVAISSSAGAYYFFNKSIISASTLPPAPNLPAENSDLPPIPSFPDDSTSSSNSISSKNSSVSALGIDEEPSLIQEDEVFYSQTTPVSSSNRSNTTETASTTRTTQIERSVPETADNALNQNVAPGRTSNSSGMTAIIFVVIAGAALVLLALVLFKKKQGMPAPEPSPVDLSPKPAATEHIEPVIPGQPHPLPPSESQPQTPSGPPPHSGNQTKI